MIFRNAGHVQKFNELKLLAGNKKSLEYDTALYILSSPAITPERVKRHVSTEGIDFPALLDGEWSRGERGLIKLAASLFNHTSWEFSFFDVFGGLDRFNTDLAIRAIRTRYEY